METAIKILWLIGSLTILGLGVVHLVYTFFTQKMQPRAYGLFAMMQSSYVKLTTRTTIWKAWQGFNSSHSTGAIFFGAINAYLVTTAWPLIPDDPFIVILDLIMIMSYTVFAWKYWFRIPFIGVAITLVSYAAALSIWFVQK